MPRRAMMSLSLVVHTRRGVFPSSIKMPLVPPTPLQLTNLQMARSPRMSFGDRHRSAAYSQDEKAYPPLESDGEGAPPFHGPHYPATIPRHHRLPYGEYHRSGPHHYGPVGFYGHAMPPPHQVGPHDPFHYEMSSQYNRKRSMARKIGVASVALLAGFSVFSMGRSYEINRLEDALIGAQVNGGDVAFYEASGNFQHSGESGYHGMHQYRGEHHGQHYNADPNNAEVGTHGAERHREHTNGAHPAAAEHADCERSPPPSQSRKKHRRRRHHGQRTNNMNPENVMQQENQVDPTKGNRVQAADVLKELEGAAPDGVQPQA